MQLHKRLLQAIAALALTVTVLAAAPAQAEQKLTELDNFPFSLAIAPQLRAELLPVTDPAGYAAAAAFPHNITEFDVLALHSGKSGSTLKLIIGRTTGKYGGPYEALHSQLAYTNGDDSKAVLVGGPKAVLPGLVNRMCIWVNGGDSGETIVLFSTVSGSDSDSLIYGVAFKTGAEPRILDMTGAHAVYGGFDVTDLDGDGRYELVGARNLDGMAGGFNYHSVRAYTGSGYTAQPDNYKDYFRGEVDFLNWVIATREAIAANPDKYLNTKDDQFPGFAYVATYNKDSYGFDTIIELPPGAGGRLDVTKFNILRRDAFQRIKTYRDELQAWLGGGPYPATWRMPK